MKAFVPDGTAMAQIDTACRITNLADNLSGGIGHTVFHPFIPFSNVVKADVKPIDVFLPENLAEGFRQ